MRSAADVLSFRQGTVKITVVANMVFGRKTKAVPVATVGPHQDEVSLFPMLHNGSKSKPPTTAPDAALDVDDYKGLASPLGLFRCGARLEQGDTSDEQVVGAADTLASVETHKATKHGTTTSMFKWRNKENNAAVDESREDAQHQRKEAKSGIFQRNKAKTESDTRVDATDTRNGVVKLFKRKGYRGGSKDGDANSARSIPTSKRAFTFQRRGNINMSEGKEERDSAPVDCEDGKGVQIKAVFKHFGQEAEKQMKVEEMPLVFESHSHVLIKVQVRCPELSKSKVVANILTNSFPLAPFRHRR